MPSRCNRWPACCTPSSSWPTSRVGTSPSSGKARSGCCSPMRQRLSGAATSPVSTRSTATSVGKEFGVDTDRARHQRPLGESPGAERPARRRDRGRRPPGRDARPRHRRRGAGRHGALLRSARRRQLSDQHARHAAQQPDAEVGCDAGSAASPRCSPTSSPRAIRSCCAAYVTHTFGVDEVQSAFDLACRPAPERVKIAITG